MCGIAGKISFSNKQISQSQIECMLDKIKHRGPDDEGVYISPNHKVGLGHRRLSIIDLSPKGHQPMSYLNRYWIVFNGEIYNYQSERQKLQRLGYKFRSDSDTEVILALYDKYQSKCLDYLRGMFSFAIFDTKTNTLFCARDRIGKKPFKYYYNRQVFIFASELKAILTQPECPKEPDMIAINHYLTLQYCPSPLTGFKDIFKLEPAHYLMLDLNTGNMIKKKYWEIDYSQKMSLSEEEWISKTNNVLEESVKLRMIADVPIGSFLSGGIDSSAVVAFMSLNSPRPIRTFSIGFEEEKYNELDYARIVANRYKTDHHELIVKPETIEVLPKLVYQYEEPYADSSALATYFVSQMARKHVTVALNGDGGDENYAGYGRYAVQQFSLFYDHFRAVNKHLINPIVSLAAKTIRNTFFDRVRRFSDTLSDDYRYRYMNYICYFTNLQKEKLFTAPYRSLIYDHNTYKIIADMFSRAGTDDKMDQTLFADFNTYLPDDLMVKVDIASMFVGLEGRSPFLDHKLFELTAKIPFDLKLDRRGVKKYILKKALQKYLPPEILHRPKMGFGVPLEYWFRKDLNRYITGIFNSKKMKDRGIFNHSEISQILHLHKSTNTSYSNHLWALLTLELWFREYFD